MKKPLVLRRKLKTVASPALAEPVKPEEPLHGYDPEWNEEENVPNRPTVTVNTVNIAQQGFRTEFRYVQEGGVFSRLPPANDVEFTKDSESGGSVTTLSGSRLFVPFAPGMAVVVPTMSELTRAGVEHYNRQQGGDRTTRSMREALLRSLERPGGRWR